MARNYRQVRRDVQVANEVRDKARGEGKLVAILTTVSWAATQNQRQDPRLQKRPRAIDTRFLIWT